MRARGDRLGDVAGEADAAVGDERHVGLGERIRHHRHGGDLRHADTRDDAGGADGARADADLHRVRTRIRQGTRGVRRCDVAGDDLQVAPARS